MYNGIRKMLHDELENIEKNTSKLTPEILCHIYQITGSLHRMDEIEEYEDGGYSNTYHHDYQSRGRDSMGRYTSRRYSRDDGYEWLRGEVNDMMMDSDSEKEKEAYRKVLRRLGK